MKQSLSKMKMIKNKRWLIIILSLLAGYNVFSQEAATSDSTGPEEKAVPELILNIRYFQPVNKIPYLLVSTKTKLERKFTPKKDIAGNVFLNDTSATSLLGKIKTDEKGESLVFIPAIFKPVWDSLTSFTFIVVTETNREFESKTTELQITKARLTIDTSSEGETRNITATVTELKNGEWIPAKDIELKIAVKRLLGNLSVGDEETYTTDSTGTAVAAFTRDSLPGDSNGSLILEIRTEDNEFYGNLFAEKTVPWGISQKADTTFNNRSLWGNRFKTPIWLLTAANIIILGVWAVLIYLIILFFKIRKSGKPDRKNTFSEAAVSYKE
jgi:hypothetical protein